MQTWFRTYCIEVGPKSPYRILGYVCGQLFHSEAEDEGAYLAITLEQPVG